MIKIDFPQVDIPQDFIVGTNITEDVLNFYRQSCRLRAGIFALCLEGNVEVSINLTNYNLKKNDFISLLPGSIIQYREQKSNVRLSFIGFSNMQNFGTAYHETLCFRKTDIVLCQPVEHISPTS